MALVRAGTSQHPRDRNRQSMIAYMALIYPVFLIVAMLGRLVPGFRSNARRASPGRSVFAEAADLTQSVVPWFFAHG